MEKGDLEAADNWQLALSRTSGNIHLVKEVQKYHLR